MKFKFILLLFAIPISIFGQSIEKIFFRGDSVFVYPIESNSMFDIELIDSLADGTYFSFFQGDTSFLRLEIHYKNNRIDGKVIEYSNYNNWIHRITEFKNGKPEGAWVEYDLFSDYNAILHEGYYKNGMKEGFHYSYHNVGSERKIYNKEFYRNDTLLYKIWQENDSIFYVNDTGYVYQFDTHKNLIGKGKEFQNNKIGSWTFFYSNGNIKSMGDYKIAENEILNFGGIKIGLWKDFFENGQISRIYLCDNKQLNIPEFTIISQFDSIGNMIDSLSFVNGKGYLRTFYADGKIMNEKFFPDSQSLKYEKYYTHNGSLFLKEEYNRNKKIRTEYYENGNIKSIERFQIFLDTNPSIFSFYQLLGKQEYFNEDGTIKNVIKIRKNFYE